MGHPEYGDLVKNTWTQAGGSVAMKLAAVQRESLIFNKDTFGNIFKKKRRLEARIKGVHLQLDSFPQADLIPLGKDLQLQYSAVLKEEEMLWFQKSRESWIKFGKTVILNFITLKL